MLHVDYYLNAHRRQYSENIWSYDLQVETFKTVYNERINTISILQNSLINSQIQIYEYLGPLALLSDSNKDCVEKYKSLITPVSSVKYNLEVCITTAKNQLNNLIANPSSTNRTLQSYYINTFEKSAQTCQKNHPASELNYTLCVQNAVSLNHIHY